MGSQASWTLYLFGAFFRNESFIYFRFLFEKSDFISVAFADWKTGSTNLIKGCSFSTNSAQDGYAMYIEGDDLGTKFDIQSNNFTDNYNLGPSADNDENITIRGVITTEIHSI